MKEALHHLAAFCARYSATLEVDGAGKLWVNGVPCSLDDAAAIFAEQRAIPTPEAGSIAAPSLSRRVRLDDEARRFTFGVVPGYECLAEVLAAAFNQAARGKGKERHAQGEPFQDQVMQQGAQRFGTGALLFQAFKKSEESQRLPHERAEAELLGAIVYLAGAVIAERRRHAANDPLATGAARA